MPFESVVPDPTQLEVPLVCSSHKLAQIAIYSKGVPDATSKLAACGCAVDAHLAEEVKRLSDVFVEKLEAFKCLWRGIQILLHQIYNLVRNMEQKAKLRQTWTSHLAMKG
jgi:hypothetical protein